MLHLTAAGAGQIAALRQERGLPDAVGLRVFEQATSDGETSFGLAFAADPAQGDEVAEFNGTRVFVAPEVAMTLAEAALDSEPTPEGPRLVLTRLDSRAAD